jgi:hypothetical protein
VIRDDHDADDNIRYCPAWSTANKPGRPAKGKRKLSALETAQGMKRKPKYLLDWFHNREASHSTCRDKVCLAALESRMLASVVAVDEEHSKWSFDWEMINKFR